MSRPTPPRKQFPFLQTSMPRLLCLGLAVLACLLLAPSAMATTAVPQAATYIYTANQIANTISAFRLDTNGKLVGISGTPFKAGTFPVAIAHDAKGRFVYTVNQGSGDLTVDRIDIGTGRLSPLPGSPFATPFAHPDAIALSPDGHHAYITGEDAAEVAVLTIDEASGIPSLPASKGSRTGRHPIHVAIAPDGHSVYVANFDDGTISAYRRDPASGRLDARHDYATDDRPIHIVVSGDSRFVYVANYGSTTVSAFAVSSADGSLRELTGSPYFAGAQPYAVTIDPVGKHLYTANWGSHDVSAFRIDPATGRLSELPEFRFHSGWYPYDIVVSPDNGHVYVANNGESTLTAFDLDRRGELEPIAPPFASDLGPYGMTIVAERPSPGQHP